MSADRNLSFDELLDEFDIKDTAWDVICIADGSGSSWGRGAGWSVILICKDGRRHEISGGISDGTVNFAELFGFVHALRYHFNCMRSNKRKYKHTAHLITDSLVTAKCGMGIYKRKKNKDVWAAIDYFESVGYELNWHWIERNSIRGHTITDKRSRRCRELVESMDELDLASFHEIDETAQS